MARSKDILLAVDETEASVKASEYVGEMVGGLPEVKVHLVHVLPPMPPELLECGGAEDPIKEERIEARVHRAQDEWVEKECRKAEPILQKMMEIMRARGVKEQFIQKHECTSVSKDDLVPALLDLAKTRDCGTVVVGRRAFHGLQKMFGHHVADQLVKHAHDLTVWVVE